MYTLLYLKWIANKDLLYSTGNSAQCQVAAWMGGEFGGEWTNILFYNDSQEMEFTKGPDILFVYSFVSLP